MYTSTLTCPLLLKWHTNIEIYQILSTRTNVLVLVSCWLCCVNNQTGSFDSDIWLVGKSVYPRGVLLHKYLGTLCHLSCPASSQIKTCWYQGIYKGMLNSCRSSPTLFTVLRSLMILLSLVGFDVHNYFWYRTRLYLEYILMLWYMMYL